MSKKDKEFNVSFNMRTLWKIKGKGKWLVMDYDTHIKHHFRYVAEARRFAKQNSLIDPVKIKDN